MSNNIVKLYIYYSDANYHWCVNEADPIFVIKKLSYKTLKALGNVYREYETLKKISEKGCMTNILCYHDSYESIEYELKDNTKNYYFNIVTKFTKNTISLSNFLSTTTINKYSQTLTLEIVLKIIYQLIAGMNYLHDLDIIHSDIKEDNIIINISTLDVQIIDFGLSCMKSFDKCRKWGTISYAPPEYVPDKIKEYNNIIKNINIDQNDPVKIDAKNKYTDWYKKYVFYTDFTWWNKNKKFDNLKKGDIYSLGCVLENIINAIKDNTNIFTNNLKQYNELFSIFNDMKNPDPSIRKNAKYYLIKIKNYIKQYNLNINPNIIQTKNQKIPDYKSYDLDKEPYLKLKIIGVGSYGKVYLAINKTTKIYKVHKIDNTILEATLSESNKILKLAEDKIKKQPKEYIFSDLEIPYLYVDDNYLQNIKQYTATLID